MGIVEKRGYNNYVENNKTARMVLVRCIDIPYDLVTLFCIKKEFIKL